MICERRDHGILVRPFVAADALPLYQAVRASIDSLSYWLPWCRPDYSRADAEAWVAHSLDAWTRQSEFPFGVFDGRSGELLGCSGLSQVNGLNRSANLGYWIGDAHRGRGIATRAAALTAAIAFEELELVRLEIVVLPHNRASLRVAEKIGATREAEARNRLMFQGQPSPAIVYSLIPRDAATNTPPQGRPCCMALRDPDKDSVVKKSPPAESPDAYVAALSGWRRVLVESLRRATLAAGKLEERIKWGHLVYFSNGPALLIRAEEKRVLFGFWRGKRLRDLEERLKPGGKYELATMVLVEGDKISPTRVKHLVRAAIELNHSVGDPTARRK